FGFTRAAANGFYFDSIDNESLVFCNEAETAFMRGFKLGAKTVGAVLFGEGGFDGEDRIGTSIADVSTQMSLNSICFYALYSEFGDTFLREFFAQFLQRLWSVDIEWNTERFLARGANISKAHAIG